MCAENMIMTNLYRETDKALLNHHLKWSNIRYIRNNQGYIKVGDFAKKAMLTYYHNDDDNMSIDPSLTIVGSNWWFERTKINGIEGWIFHKKPLRPSLEAINPSLESTEFLLKTVKWEPKIEK